jgi:5'-nucleotidase
MMLEKMDRHMSRLFLILALCALFACNEVKPSGNVAFSLTILHVNDTHAHLESTELSLDILEKKIYVQLGGFTRLAQQVEDLCKQGENILQDQG